MTASGGKLQARVACQFRRFCYVCMFVSEEQAKIKAGNAIVSELGTPPTVTFLITPHLNGRTKTKCIAFMARRFDVAAAKPRPGDEIRSLSSSRNSFQSYCEISVHGLAAYEHSTPRRTWFRSTRSRFGSAPYKLRHSAGMQVCLTDICKPAKPIPDVFWERKGKRI